MQIFARVSIPYSTIKMSRELKEVKDKPVSIPYSTIKICVGPCQVRLNKRFNSL